MARQSFVEMEDGEQYHFDSVYEALKYAKTQEAEHKNSVEYLAISEDVTSLDQGLTVYRGQKLRHMIRSVDNVAAWVQEQVEQTQWNEEKSSEAG
jgi:hypothetical protein